MEKHTGTERTALSRRNALKRCGVALAGAGMTAAAPALAAPVKGPLNMRIALAAYSFREHLTDGRMDLFRLIDWAAKLNLSGIELTSYYFKDGFDNKYLRELRHRVLDNGMTISGTAIRNNFNKPEGPGRQGQIDNVKRWIDYAAELWAPHIRIFAGNLSDGVSREDGIKWVADSIRACLDHAAERGVNLGVENHGSFTSDIKDHMAIVEAVGPHDWFGVNLDTGNYRFDYYNSIRQAIPYAKNVQFKVEMWVQEDGSREKADLHRICDLLMEGGYKGWIALEYESKGDPFIEVPKKIKEMKELFEG